jgi:hypothetical protein
MRKIMGFSIALMLAFTVVGAWAVATTPDQGASQMGGVRINALELMVPTASLPSQQFDTI